MSLSMEGFSHRIPYKKGDKLIVFKKTGTTELKRKFRRILEFDRLEKLSFKRIQKFPVKEVVCCIPDTVEFSDGSIEWTSSVAKPGELKKKLSYHIDRVEKKERKTKKINKAKIALLYPKLKKERSSFINLYNEIIKIIRFPFHYLRN